METKVENPLEIVVNGERFEIKKFQVQLNEKKALVNLLELQAFDLDLVHSQIDCLRCLSDTNRVWLKTVVDLVDLRKILTNFYQLTALQSLS